MGPLTAVTTAFVKTLSFSGRASRSEYWWYFLFYMIACAVAVFVDLQTAFSLFKTGGESALYTISPFDLISPWVSMALSVPMIALSIRRLHDAGFSGFWLLLYFVPVAGLALIILHMLPSEDRTTAQGAPAAGPIKDPAGRPVSVDAHKRAMQGYAVLFDKDKPVSPAQQAARKAEISEYYRSKVLKPSAPV